MTSPTPLPSPSEPPRFPPPVAGWVLYAVIMAVGLVAWFVPFTLAIVTIPFLVLAATAVLARALRVDIPKTLLLRLPSAPDFFMAIPLAISLFIVSEQLSNLYQFVFPMPDEVLDQARRLLAIDGPLEWIIKVAALGLGAAVSEELAFRGFIQTAFTRGSRPIAAIVLTATLFTVLHFPFFTILLPALVLGSIAAATNSILVTVFIHFCNNVGALLLFNVAGLETLGDPLWISPTILIPALVLFVLSWGYYLRFLEPDPEARKTVTASRERERITVAHEPKSIAEELAAVPRGRRRLGWLVVATAMLGGVLVLLGLFVWSFLVIYPERFHAGGITLLERTVNASLEPDASDEAPQVSSAFRALDALNDSGQMDLGDLYEVARIYVALNADGGLNGADANAIVETIRMLVMEKTTPKTL